MVVVVDSVLEVCMVDWGVVFEALEDVETGTVVVAAWDDEANVDCVFEVCEVDLRVEVSEVANVVVAVWVVLVRAKELIPYRMIKNKNKNVHICIALYNKAWHLFVECHDPR